MASERPNESRPVDAAAAPASAAPGVGQSNDPHTKSLAVGMRAGLDPSRFSTLGEMPPGPVDATFQIGPYRCVRLLGSGGMGAVFEAHDDRLGRRVALKAIHGTHRFDDAARARFLREARMLSRLEHPSICRLYEYLEDTQGTFLVLEYVDGRPLGLAAPGLSRSQRLRVAEQVAKALLAAHAAGIVHRDLKPDNVMVTAEGDAKVLDFGIARVVRDAATGAPPAGAALASGATPSDAREENPLHTSPGVIIGTPLYMSPEQATGADATPASDMYAFGLLLQELLTGERPVDASGDVFAVLERVRRGERRPMRGADRDLTRLVGQLTSVHAEQRPTAAEAVRRLDRVRTRPVRRGIAAAVAAIALAGIAGAAKYAIDLGNERFVAVKARGDAERLVAYMTQELGESLRPIGGLDALGGVAEEVIDYYGSRGIEGLADDEVHQYVSALLLMGEVQFTRREVDLQSAARAFGDAGRLASALVQRDPVNGAYIKSLAHVQFWNGSIALRHGQLAAATNEFEQYHQLALRLVQLDGSNADWLQEVGYSCNNLVFVYRGAGDLAGARRQLDESLAVKRRLVALDPHSAAYRKDLANGLNTLAEEFAAAGERSDARSTFDESIALLRAVTEEHADDREARYRLAISHVKLGEFLEQGDAPREAMVEFRKAQAVARVLVEVDPSNVDWQREIAIMHRSAGRAAHAAGEVEQARLELAASKRILVDLVGRERGNVKWQSDLARTCLAVAAVEDAPSERAQRVASLSAASEHFFAAAGASTPGPACEGLVLEGVGALGREAVARLACADSDGARAARLAQIERASSVTSEQHANRRDALMALALLSLDRLDEAKSTLAQLRARGGTVPDDVRQLAVGKGILDME